MPTWTEQNIRKNIPALPDLQTIEIQEVEAGRVVYGFTPPATLANYHGNMHGGLVYTLCEIAAGMVGSSLDKDNVALNGSINYVRRCPLEQPLTVTGTTSHNGRSTIVVHVSVTAEDKLIAEATYTLFVLSE